MNLQRGKQDLQMFLKQKKNGVQLTTAAWVKGARIDFLHRKFLTVK